MSDNKISSTVLQMLPPWIAFPDYSLTDERWVTDEAASKYIDQFWESYNRMCSVEQVTYQREYPEPQSWNGCYDDYCCVGYAIGEIKWDDELYDDDDDDDDDDWDDFEDSLG